MLTKDLLRFSCNRQNRIFPRFIDVTNKTAQDLASQLALLYAEGKGQSRDELAELAQPIINAYRSPLIAKGLHKLLLDRCQFHEPGTEVESFRLELFAMTAELLKTAAMNSLEHYREMVSQTVRKDLDTLAAELFSDLPSRQLLKSFRPTSPEKLLHRYNMAQAQGLLFTATRMNLTIQDADTGKLRFFFRYLKFYRVLVRIQKESEECYRLELDGPLTLFDQVRKYGLRFASLLPVICLLARWSLTAKIKPDQHLGSLELNQDDGLVSHYSITTAYVPEEYEKFYAQFSKDAQEWTILKESTLVNLGKQEIAIPDFSFRHRTGRTVHLELFHRWHAGPLLRRLDHLTQVKKRHVLALGVDRFLLKDASTAEQIKKFPWFQQHGFEFNEFPPVQRVVKCLESFLGDV